MSSKAKLGNVEFVAQTEMFPFEDIDHNKYVSLTAMVKGKPVCLGLLKLTNIPELAPEKLAKILTDKFTESH